MLFDILKVNRLQYLSMNKNLKTIIDARYKVCLVRLGGTSNVFYLILYQSIVHHRLTIDITHIGTFYKI
jgi:hypothetical protein